MAHYGLLGSYELAESAEDIRGAELYGLDDEKLGKIDDVIFDHTSGTIQYAVVDTGGWLRTKEFLVPAERIRASSRHEDDFTCDLSKEQIENFPPYNKKDLESEDHWKDYEKRYRAKWETGPVMHRAETDRNITPTTEQLQGNPNSIGASEGTSGPVAVGLRSDEDESVEPAGASTGRVVPAGHDTVVINNSASGIGGRWDTFQARLRERRKEAAAGCNTCSIGPQSVRESTDRQKKAI